VIFEQKLTQICEVVLYRTEILSRQDNGKIEVVSFVIESGRKLTISEVYVKNLDRVPPCD